MSVDEYLKMERDSPIRHEYIAGEIFAMGSPALRHEMRVRD
jgi:Uma2 family endonuclease